LSASEIATKLDLPERLARKIINDLEEMNLVNEVKPMNQDLNPGYQPAVSEQKLTLHYITQRLDRKGVNEIPINSIDELSLVENKLSSFENIIENSSENILVKDLLNLKS
jgi:membrane protein